MDFFEFGSTLPPWEPNTHIPCPPHLSAGPFSRVCADLQMVCPSPSLSPSAQHYSRLSIETLAFYTEGRNTMRDFSFSLSNELFLPFSPPHPWLLYPVTRSSSLCVVPTHTSLALLPHRDTDRASAASASPLGDEQDARAERRSCAFPTKTLAF